MINNHSQQNPQINKVTTTSNGMKFTFKTETLPILIVLISIVLGFYFYSVFPDQVPVHWNVAGEIDRWGSKFEGAWLMPLIAIGMYILFLILPIIDPRKEKYNQFAKIYLLFRMLILLMMLGIYLIASLNSLGHNIRVEVWIPIVIGLSFIIIGNYMGKIKSNWFLGIRTPWTLSSETVWNKTHRLGGKLFMLMGILLIITPLLPYHNIFFVLIIPVLIISLIPVVYSYLLYRKEKK
ncbi:SdpI family protein [Patescibacteria group bacterium]|nr:SdpI family protein [Patescibacteria group bacterium]